ncbi:hypothetical protein [Haloplanus rubicundus]|uniref:Uncharacterized protein n=1 Tax=Haloplanus rubicundus TaxID=1547898 RepID=A0A345EBC4_9EURY|nr:hypothetical protein [Haloplanus rubicundus]AXG09496.1 hypothetical protein DU484_06225 [Haloplanus rubicundus]
MQTACTTGLTSRTTREGPSGNQPDDGDCVVCGGEADGIDAGRDGNPPVCGYCAKIRADGGRDVSAGRRTVTSSITFGGCSSNHVSTPGDDMNHLSGEVGIEVSGASTDYPHPTRLQREIEAAVGDVLDDYAERVSDDVDRGDGPVTDGGGPDDFERQADALEDIAEQMRVQNAALVELIRTLDTRAAQDIGIEEPVSGRSGKSVAGWVEDAALDIEERVDLDAVDRAAKGGGR